MSEQKLMKHGLSTDAVKRICTVLAVIIDDFPVQQFQNEALKGLDELELKQRVEHLITVLNNYLPDDFPKVAAVLLQVKQHWDWGDDKDSLSGFAAWPLIDYVAVHGLKYPDISLNVLKELTPLFSAEFAIRPFIEQHFEFTHTTLLQWAHDSDEHVRRLASEGIRPRLPWGTRLTKLCNDPTPIVPILEQLKTDSSLYVRKSVANNLNDISKDHPELVIELCQQWIIDAPKERQWIIQHGLRTLVKAGCEEVFPLLGYTQAPELEIKKFKLATASITLGQQAEFSVELISKSAMQQRLVVDYKVYHQKANGKTTAKVFKWKNVNLAAGEKMCLAKAHSFKLITTRKYYSGEHVIELLINGKSYGEVSVELII